MKTSRRSFMGRLGAAFAFLLIAPALVLKKARNAWAEPDRVSAPEAKTASNLNSLVAAEPCMDYNEERVFGAVRKALEDIRFEIPPGKRVLLKPNIMAQNKPDQAASTHPAVVGALCRLFREKGCDVTIGDSSAFYQGGGTRLGLETTGMAEVARKYGAKLLPFEAALLRKVETGRVVNPLYITEAVYTHDIVVNIPKLKIHRLARYSGAVKNTYGCVVGGTKQLYHKLFSSRPDYQEYWGKPLVDVYEAVNPALNVMDAITGLDKDGPAANGKPRETGVILVSRSGPALDIAACRMIGFDPLWVPALREAIERKLALPEEVSVIGQLPVIAPYVKLPDLKPKSGFSKSFDDFTFDQFIMKPEVKRSRCGGCSVCVTSCVPGAMSLDKDGKAVIDDSKCIRCYCCSEFCPKQAVSLHGGVTNHAMRGMRVILGL